LKSVKFINSTGSFIPGKIYFPLTEFRFGDSSLCSN
jgi:hypothetical protein